MEAMINQNENIALVYPHYNHIVFDTLSVPLGLAWISSYLQRHNFKTDCYDLAINPYREKELLESKHKYYGVQLHSYESLSESLDLISKIKKFDNSAIVIVGGLCTSTLWETLLTDDNVDFVIIGEGEVTFLELLKQLTSKEINLKKIDGLAFKQGRKLIRNKDRIFIENLDYLSLPDRKSFKPTQYPQWSIITSRGCPYKCSFCVVPEIWRKTSRYRSAESIYEELCILEKDYGMSKFFILDEIFPINKKRTIKLLEYIIKGKHNFKWACLSRADLVDKEILKLLKLAGCYEISYGVESANQDSLDYINKNIRLSEIERAIRITKEIGIRVRCSYIFGLPNEDITHLTNNINFMVKTEPHEIQLYTLFPYLGTQIQENSSTIKMLNHDSSTWKKDALNPIVETNKLKKDDIVNMVRKCIDTLESKKYRWLSSHNIKPASYNYEKTIMTEFCPIQSIDT